MKYTILAAGLRTRNLDVKALQAVFELLQSHYPERLAALWFLNAPFIFWGVWRLVSPSWEAFVEAAVLHCASSVSITNSSDELGLCKVIQLMQSMACVPGAAVHPH